ncbi:hypothetical protein RMCBS344292_01675 [Rhizopus microsporus]|nr:hypothetical protein RMCBS344292_01675 [Rhizopus microsporus]
MTQQSHNNTLRHSLTDGSVTTQDIANLYSNLQTMMGSVPKSPKLSEEIWQRNPLPVTPTHSSPTLKKKIPKEPHCPCHHILVSKDSQHCALCDDVIPILSELQQEREKQQQTLTEREDALSAERERAKTLMQDVTALNKKYKDVSDRLDQRNQEYTSLQKDMKTLEEKYSAEKQEAEKAKKAKADVESELEELSQRLFEEANGMVANEKRERHQIEIQYRHLQQELKICREQMEAEELQLKELKMKLADLDQRRYSKNSRLDDLNSTTSSSLSISDEEDQLVEKRASGDASLPFLKQDDTDCMIGQVDSLLLHEFKEFMLSSKSMPIRKLHTQTYMKHCLTEDIEPCLRFGPNSRLVPKKLYEAMLLNTCFIEETPEGFVEEQAKTRGPENPLKVSAAKTMIWERLSSSTSTPGAFLAGCQACGRETSELPYRFRISRLDDWACIDRYCRDRLVAVCEFYGFIRNVLQGHYNGRSVSDLFQESIKLKLRMFYARIGTLSQTVNKEEVGHISDTKQVDDDNCSTSTAKCDSLASIQSQKEDRDTTRSFSIHPGNSVWIHL